MPCDRFAKKILPTPFLMAMVRNGISSHHFDILPLSKEIKMKVSLACRTLIIEQSKYGDAKVVV